MKIRVLIADDHAVVRDGLRAVLETHPDITVVGDAPDGEKAVELALELAPDVVIMDIGMPELDGISSTLQIAEAVPFASVIILSMSGTAEQVFDALQAGARGYLLKESAGREVINAVLACHAGNFYLSQPIINTLVSDYLQYRQKPSEPCTSLEKLSRREREILPLVASGKSSIEIAEMLFISSKSVDTYRSRLMRKLGVNDLPGLVRFAIQNDLLP
nr:response regulator transcription factor [Anaerolineae bacterium]